MGRTGRLRDEPTRPLTGARSRRSMSGQSQQGGGAGADPSMEDILASIRRILSEEDVPAATPAQQSVQEHEAEQGQDVLLLDSSMLVAEVPPARPVIRARAVPPPPPPVLTPPEPAPVEPTPVEAKVAEPEPVAAVMPEPEPVEAR